ncbi:MAG: zinc-ribbon domain-containing protein, partial [Methylocella sp.]
MIISCPSCATRYDMPASRIAAEGTMIKCAACGQSWLEGRAIEV